MMKMVPIVAAITVVATASIANDVAKPEPYCDWAKKHGVIVAEANKRLFMSTTRRVQSIRRHLPFGIRSPSTADNEFLLIQPHYIIRYDADLLMPVWTAHRLRKEDIVGGERINAFRRDPRLTEPKSSPECSDYKEGIFDRGHMVPRADMNRTLVAMINTFMMTNMAPQYCAFNRGPWRVLEEFVRQWAIEDSPVYVITGAVFDRDDKIGRDPDSKAARMYSEADNRRRVAIPSEFYKVIIRERNGQWEGLAISLPHSRKKVPLAKTKDYIAEYVKPISYLVDRTGTTFHPKAGEIKYARELWKGASLPHQDYARSCKYPQSPW